MPKRKMGQESEGPGSASLTGHMAYGGSRQLATRWEYSESSGAGFAELHHDHTPTGADFFKMLQQVPGVTHVQWHISKTEPGNVGDHYMERNILVTSSLGPGSASQPFEFELTRNHHMKDKRLPFTVTACFKEPSPDMIPEAWRILTEVIKGKELWPRHVGQYRAKALKRWENNQLHSQVRDDENEAVASAQKLHSSPKFPPGSASGSDALPRSTPSTSAAAGQDATNAQLPDEENDQKLKSMEPPGSASGSDAVPRSPPSTAAAPGQNATAAQLPDENDDEEADYGNDEEFRLANFEESERNLPAVIVEMSTEFKKEVEEPVADSSNDAVEEAARLTEARTVMFVPFLQPQNLLNIRIAQSLDL